MDHRTLADVATAGTALASPVWLEWVTAAEPAIKAIMLIGGLCLLVLRLAISLREWHHGRKEG